MMKSIPNFNLNYIINMSIASNSLILKFSKQRALPKKSMSHEKAMPQSLHPKMREGISKLKGINFKECTTYYGVRYRHEKELFAQVLKDPPMIFEVK